MKINNPIAPRGTIMLNYRGMNTKWDNNGSILEPCTLIRQVPFPDLNVEIAVLEFKLFDELKVRASLFSGSLYNLTEENKWLKLEESFIHTCDNQTNSKFIILNGQICHHNRITPNHIFRDDYNMTIIFKPIPILEIY